MSAKKRRERKSFVMRGGHRSHASGMRRMLRHGKTRSRIHDILHFSAARLDRALASGRKREEA